MSRFWKNSFWLAFAMFGLIAFPNSAAGAGDSEEGRTYLHKNWQIQSSCEVKATGEQISSAGFDAAGWHKADIPATVVGALVTDKTYPDPDYAMNLKSFPGMNYSSEHLFANQFGSQEALGLIGEMVGWKIGRTFRQSLDDLALHLV